MEKKETLFRLLDADEIECRVGQQGTSSKGPWCTLLLYKDARCDMKRLDEVYGTSGWQREHQIIGNSVVCIISVWDDNTNQWVKKMDVGTAAKTEPEKSVFSDSFKRAATNVGIGRELYTGPRVFVWLAQSDFNKSGKISTTFRVAKIGYDTKRKIKELVIVDNKGAVRYLYGITAQQYNEWLAKQKDVKVAESPLTETQQSASQTVQTTGDEAMDKELSEALSQIDKATNVDQLVAIYNSFQGLQGQHGFTSKLTAKRVELSNKKSA